MATGSIGYFSIISPSQKRELERKRQKKEAREAAEAAKRAETARNARIAREESEAKRRAEIESQISQIKRSRTAKITALIITGIALSVGIIWLFIK